MNSLAYACVTLVGSAVSVFASPTDRVIIAAMSLSEHSNYSWFSTIDESSGSYEIEGCVTRQGITWLRLPMLSSIGRRLGRESETQLEALFQGRTLGVVRVGGEWLTLADLPAPRERESGPRSRTMVRGSAGGSFGIAGGQSVGAAAPFLEDRRGSRTFATLQSGVSHPHEELAILVSSHTRMDVAGNVASGTLSELGAALLLVRGEQADVEPVAASGSFKLWLHNGAVTKYHLKLEGVLASRWKKTNVQFSSTTTLRDIGTTHVHVPDEARIKLATLGR